jgi:C1A family cysteine protease
VALIEYFEKKALKHWVDASRLFVYKVTRNLLGWKGDQGAYIRTTMHTLACFGAPPEQHWPYDGSPEEQNKRFDMEPPAFCYAFAGNYKSLKYYRLDPNGAAPGEALKRIRAHLATGFPAMFGFPVYEEFMHPQPGGKIGYPSPNSHQYGGHAIVACGYDDGLMIGPDKGALLIRNSWGTDWGEAGYGWMPYKYVSAGLAVDWWTVISQQWVDTGVFA